MHLPNGAVTPACAVIGLGVAGAGLVCGYLAARKTAMPEPWRFAAGTALVMLLQAINLPIAPGISGHLVGGFLLAMWFGAGWGLFAMTLALAMQCALFGDGGTMTLGLNIVNMGVLPCLVVYPLWRRFSKQRPGSVALASWVSVFAASLLCAMELLSSASARAQAGSVLTSMLTAHALIGVIEMLGTLAILMLARQLATLQLAPRRIAIGACAILLLLLATFVSSPKPDGLQFTLTQLHH